MPMDENAKVLELLKKFDNAMLVTRLHDGTSRTRPMVIAQVDEGSIWFLASNTSEMVSEIDRDPWVALTMQQGNQFLGISGHARFSEDRAKIAEVWKSAHTPLFPKGKDDPEVCLIHILVDEAEYWKDPGASKVSFLVGAARAILTGKPEQNGKDHARTRLA